MKRIVLGITGASGAVYARRLARLLLDGGCRVEAVVSAHGESVLRRELGLASLTGEALLGRPDAGLALHDPADLADPLASGSVATDGMAVCPCSMNTLGALACGRGDTLLTRAAHVHLKQRRRLVLVPREMPVSAVDLGNQLRLARAGAVIAPACPGYYLQPRSIDDLVTFVAARVADLLGVEHDLDVQYRRGDPGETE